jgi:hypothetical protein
VIHDGLAGEGVSKITARFGVSLYGHSRHEFEEMEVVLTEIVATDVKSSMNRVSVPEPSYTRVFEPTAVREFEDAAKPT